MYKIPIKFRFKPICWTEPNSQGLDLAKKCLNPNQTGLWPVYVACCNGNCCPKCLVAWHHLGQPQFSARSTVDSALGAMEDAALGDTAEAMHQGLCPNHPFWDDLPHSDIFSSFTPNFLHQLHKGVFKDHIVKWVTECLEGGKKEIYLHFHAMPQGNNLQHFKTSISLVSQWSGTKYKNMERVFLGVLAGPSEPGLIHIVHATLDFIYYAHFESHTIDSLHNNLHYFVDQGIHEDCDDFNILKLLKWNIMRCYSDLKLNIPTRNCIGSLCSQDLLQMISYQLRISNVQ